MSVKLVANQIEIQTKDVWLCKALVSIVRRLNTNDPSFPGVFQTIAPIEEYSPLRALKAWGCQEDMKAPSIRIDKDDYGNKKYIIKGITSKSHPVNLILKLFCDFEHTAVSCIWYEESGYYGLYDGGLVDIIEIVTIKKYEAYKNGFGNQVIRRVDQAFGLRVERLPNDPKSWTAGVQLLDSRQKS
jgi:hypothetical protein